MRKLLFVLVIVSGVAWAHEHDGDYAEQRELSTDADGIRQLDIDAGAGSLAITGVDGASEIVVNATVRVTTSNEKKATAFIAKRMQLTLRRDGDRAILKSHFGDNWRLWGPTGSIDLDIRVPSELGLIIDDGSGSIAVDGVSGGVSIDDGSGSIRLRNVGGVAVDDGSGGIDIDGVTGDVIVDDGSGGLKIRSVDGSVKISDGSGGINVDGVTGDLVIEDSGAGSLTISNVQGRVIGDDE